MLRGDRSLSELGPHALSSAGPRGCGRACPRTGSTSPREQRAFPIKGPASHRRVASWSVTAVRRGGRQHTNASRDVMPSTGWGSGAGDSLVLLTPTPRRAWLRGCSPRFAPSQMPWAGSRELPEAGFAEPLSHEAGEQETAPSARGLREEQMTRLAARSLWRSTADDQEVIRQ